MADFHAFTVGDFQCYVLHEGSAEMSIANLSERYSNVTQDDINAALDTLNHTGDTAESHMNALLIVSDEGLVLVDTGLGTARQPQFGNLLPALHDIGYASNDIDVVFLTHFHGDHIGALVDEDGVLTFPEARYVTHKKEWAHWMDEDFLAQQSDEYRQRMEHLLLPIREKLVYVEGEHDVVSGVTVVEAFGHTPGHSGLRLRSGDEELLHLVDTLHHAAQMHYPGWHFKYDSDADQAEATRRAWLAETAASGVLFLAV